MRYMLLYWIEEAVETGELPDTSDAIENWIAEMNGRGIRVTSGRLRPPADATTVRRQHGEVLIADGPFAETKEQIGGYDVIDVANLDEALEVAAKHPAADGGIIEVRPFWTW